MRNSKVPFARIAALANRDCRRLSALFVVVFAVLMVGCARDHEVAKYDTPYHHPLNSPGGKFSGLPPAVQNSIRAQTGGAYIQDITKDTSSGEVVYQVSFVNTRLYPPLLIRPDGSVLNPDLTVAVGAGDDIIGITKGGAGGGLKSSDLPKDVMKVVQEQAPNSEIAYISKEVLGEREVYMISFKDSAHNPTLYVAADGTLVNRLPR